VLKRTPEQQGYLRGLRTWVGFRQTGIVVERDERFAGRSKYDRMQLLRLVFDGMFAFFVVPLRAASVVGLVAITLALGYIGYAVSAKLVLEQSRAGSPG